MKHGRDLIISINGTDIAKATSADVDIQQKLLDAASPTEGRANRKIASIYSWSISSNMLVASWSNITTLIGYITNGSELDVRIKMRIGTDAVTKQDTFVVKSGKALVSSVRVSGNVGSLAKASIQLEGSGALS